MNDNQFSAMLAIIVPPIIEQIIKNSNVDENKAISKFYEMSDKWKHNPDENSLCEAIGHIYNQSNVNNWETCFGEALINKANLLSRYLKQKILSDI